jgi:CubicO group peptidase (beta-lactamase class C family)
MTLESVASRIRDAAATYCEKTGVPGYLAGVYHDGEEIVVFHGVANIVTKAPMLEDTGFLAGSITKPMTGTLLMQQAERGTVDLDERVVTYLPEFQLPPPAAADEMRVRHLLNHTDGIDADFFFPDACGRDALQVFVRELARGGGALFAPGEYVSYSSGGMLVAGRLLEVLTGTSYHDLLQCEIYEQIGMTDSSTSAEDAILRSTAVGHFPDRASGGVRRTDMFKLPDSWSSAGATPIVTIHDLLAFARTHLADGVSPSGKRVLSPESMRCMRSVAFDMGAPNISPMGLGWPLLPLGETMILWHGGSSPGGTATLVLIPHRDLAFASYGNHPAATALHHELTLWLLRDYLHLPVPDRVVEKGEVDGDLRRYEGTYRSNQQRVDVKVKDGQLEEQIIYEPTDTDSERIFTKFAGGGYAFPPQRLVPIRKDLFAIDGISLESLGYIAARYALVSFHGDWRGRPTHRSLGGRMTRRDQNRGGERLT